MAYICRGQGRRIAGLLALLVALLLAALPTAQAQLYEQPLLVIDPGMHTAQIGAAGVDAAGKFAVTGSWDKTVRVWSLTDGKLLPTVRMPAGPGNIGKIYAVAMSPEGGLGFTSAPGTEESIYLFEALTGKMVKAPSGPAAPCSRARRGKWTIIGKINEQRRKSPEFGVGQQIALMFDDKALPPGVYQTTVDAGYVKDCLSN